MNEHHTYRVLLVDDERSSYEFVQTLLHNSPEDRYHLDWVSKYESAVEGILAAQHDVCLLDYNMGTFTGLDVLRYVRQQGGTRLPIVVLTGYGNHSIDLESLHSGAAEYLDKSRLKADMLTRTIRYAVKHQQDKNELADLYRQVSELEQLKTDMIRIAAHDLRTPLMTMLNYANFLRDDDKHPLLDYQVGYVGEIVSSVRRMQQIISDILSLERIQETAAERYEQHADLAEQIHLAAEAALARTTGHVITMDVPQSGVLVQGDASQLREAAMNLMTNAVKYTPEGASITLRLAVDGDVALFTVEDAGYGIPKDMQSRLFQPFYRAKSKETRRIEGTGLGLYLVRNIIHRHGGEIVFHSVYGEGSTFGFSVPLLPTR